MTRICFKLFLLIVAMSVLQTALGYFFTLPQISVVDKLLKNDCGVMYLGDSSVTNLAVSDTDRATLPEIVLRMNPGLSVCDGSHPAYSTPMFEYVLDYISRQTNKPNAVIIPINLRSFSPEWDMRPEYQFEKEKFYFTVQPRLFSAWYRPLAIFRVLNVNTISQERYLKTPVFDGREQIGTMVDFFDEKKFSSTTPENIRAKYVVKYMGAIKKEDENILSLGRALDIANRAGIRAYVYITPVDYEGGEKYVGEYFKKQIRENVAMVCKAVEEKNIDCIDLSEGVPRSGFDFGSYPNEHLNETGRLFVAEKVSEMLRGGE
jgi:hypothetical protein